MQCIKFRCKQVTTSTFPKCQASRIETYPQWRGNLQKRLPPCVPPTLCNVHSTLPELMIRNEKDVSEDETSNGHWLGVHWHWLAIGTVMGLFTAIVVHHALSTANLMCIEYPNAFRALIFAPVVAGLGGAFAGISVAVFWWMMGFCVRDVQSHAIRCLQRHVRRRGFRRILTLPPTPKILPIPKLVPYSDTGPFKSAVQTTLFELVQKLILPPNCRSQRQLPP